MKILGFLLKERGGVPLNSSFSKGFDGGTGNGMHCHVAWGHVTTLGAFEFAF